MKGNIRKTLKTAKKTKKEESELFRKNYYSIRRNNNLNFEVPKSSFGVRKKDLSKSKVKKKKKSMEKPQKLRISKAEINKIEEKDSYRDDHRTTPESKYKDTRPEIKKTDINVKRPSKVKKRSIDRKTSQKYSKAKSSEMEKKHSKLSVRKSVPKPNPYPFSTKKNNSFGIRKPTGKTPKKYTSGVGGNTGLSRSNSKINTSKSKSKEMLLKKHLRSRDHYKSKLINNGNVGKYTSNVFKQNSNKKLAYSHRNISNRTPSQSKSKKRSVGKKSISPGMLKKKMQIRSKIAQNSFKLNLSDLLNTDDIFQLILNSKPGVKGSFNFEILRQYLIFNYCFILKDLNILFNQKSFQEKMRVNYLRELNYFIFLLLLLIELQVERAVNKRESVFSRDSISQSDKESLRIELYELIVQIISHLHIVFILRTEIFLERAAVYYQDNKHFKELKKLISKRKSNYNIYSSKRDDYNEYVDKIERYLELTEQALHEMIKLNKNFMPLSFSLFENLKQIGSRKGEITIKEVNSCFLSLNISFDQKGLKSFDPAHLSSLLKNGDKGEADGDLETPQPPFIKKPRDKSKRFTLVLDLDETLIHYPDDKLFNFEEKAHENVLVRPFIRDFLVKVAEKFELVIFTAGSQAYADTLIDFIDPKGVIAYRLYRKHMTLHNHNMIKDLSKIGRKLENVIILDNTPENFILQPQNGIYVQSWRGEKNDKVFMWLGPLFDNIAQLETDDVREVLVDLKNLLLGDNSKQ